MAREPLALPPGVYRNGTEYQAKGRYYDANLVRWNPSLCPIGGWRTRVATAVSGMPRAALAWKDNAGLTWLAIGTHRGIYVMNRAETVYDITPASGFTSGLADSVSRGGYGTGKYGRGTYGTPRADTAVVQDATQWTLCVWGQYLLGVSPDDGNILQWQLNTSNKAAKVTNSPTCKSIVVTSKGFLFALNGRTVSWCDQQDNETWTPSSTNQAGDFPLQTGGSLMCGENVSGGTLLFTDVDVHLATWVGGIDVYGFEPVGDACGVVSRQATTAFDKQAFWMSKSGFKLYNGYVQDVPCDLWDYIVKDINWSQKSKIFIMPNSTFSEIEVYYCSAASTEIDRCVVVNYKNWSWNIGRPSRLCGVDDGVFKYPIKVGVDGTIYDHEIGTNYDGDTPYAETGPLELGNGDYLTDVDGIIPDEATLGDVNVSFITKMESTGPETSFGPYTLASKTDFRFTARQIRTRYTGVRLTNWAVGTPRLLVSRGSER